MTEFPEKYQPFIRSILDYYALPYINIVVENRDDFVACQGMSTVHLSRKFLVENSDDAIQTVLAHEISHRTLLPGTAVEQEAHVIISQIEGIEINHIYKFLNIIYDLSIDRTNMLHRDWSELYTKGMEQLLPTRLGINPVTKPDKWPFTTKPVEPDTVFANLLVSMVYDRYQWNYTLRDIEQQVYELLYVNNRPFEKRLVDLARIFKDLYKNTPEEPEPQQNMSNEQSQNGESGDNSQSQQQSSSNNQSDSKQDQSNNSSDGSQDSDSDESNGNDRGNSSGQQNNSNESSDKDQDSNNSENSSGEKGNSQDSNNSSSSNSPDNSSENEKIEDKFKATPDKKLPFERNLTEEELKEVAKKLAEMYDDIPNHIPVNPTIRHEFKKRRAKKFALPLITAGNNTYSRELTPAGTWSSSCPAHELNMLKTISMNGVFIPDFTTQRVKDTLVKGTPTTKKNPHLVILADVSGSMKGSPVEQLIDVTIALNMIAKRNGWPVSLIKFNSMASTLIEKSWDYNKIDDFAAGLVAGGNTNILSAIAKAEKLGKGLVIFIITDEKNSSLTDKRTLHYLKKIKNNNSETFLYAIGKEFSTKERGLLKTIVKEAFCIPKNQPFAAKIISNAMKL
jgi:uncharacterized protein with von Willebrand factor type A (vWA) domain